jgi:predicted transcriptional regulator
MDQSTANRLSVKHPENTLYQQLLEQLGLSPVQADAAVEIFLEWAQKNISECRAPGQIVRTVVDATEPAGKPLSACQLRDVILTIDHRNDADIQHRHGTVALRQAKVLRLSFQTYEQGGLLSYEDLASILGLDNSTIKRLVAQLRELGFDVPTRGAVKDIGRAPSHKEPVGRLLCRGYVYTEITAITGHCERSIERYALALGRVIALCDQGAAKNDIRIICELSEASVAIYIQLYNEHNTAEFRNHLDTLKRRFEAKGIIGPGQVPHKKRPSQSPIERMANNDLLKAIRQRLQQDLGLTEAVAQMMAERLMPLIETSYADVNHLKPGQLTLLVDSASSAPKVSSSKATADRPLVPVTLSVLTTDKLEIWYSDRPLNEKRALIADALAREAQHQGGTMTVYCLAVLLGISSSAMSAALTALRQRQQDPTPIKGITEDAGATLTHKEMICDLQDQGYTPPEISIIALHEPQSRDRYLKTNLRVETLIKVLETIPDEVQAARFLGIQRSVVKQYLQRLQKKRTFQQNAPPQQPPQPSQPSHTNHEAPC